MDKSSKIQQIFQNSYYDFCSSDVLLSKVQIKTATAILGCKSGILSVDDNKVTFSARGKLPGEPRRSIILQNTEFIRRYLMHVLPLGFQKIRYYGFLNHRMKSKNLKLIFKLQGYQKFKQRYAGMSMAELLNAVWNFDICSFSLL